MKIDRLIGILSVLLQQEKVTAPELAEKFEVSRRTIQRDIEDLCKAGIPLVTLQGGGGGIQIMDGYKPSKTLLTSREMQGIMAGLRSLDSVSGTKYYSHLMDKLKLGASAFSTGKDTMLIDLSSWSREMLAPKIDLINHAIEERRMLSFCYISSKGEGRRQVEPYSLVFKWSSWYLYGFCLERQDFRMFKLTRVSELVAEKYSYETREVPMPEFTPSKIWEEEITVKAIFSNKVKWRVVDEYGIEAIREMEDGRIWFEAPYVGKEALLDWILSFGDKVELIEPVDVKETLFKIICNMKQMYIGGNEDAKTTDKRGAYSSSNRKL